MLMCYIKGLLESHLSLWWGQWWTADKSMLCYCSNTPIYQSSCQNLCSVQASQGEVIDSWWPHPGSQFGPGDQGCHLVSHHFSIQPRLAAPQGPMCPMFSRRRLSVIIPCPWFLDASFCMRSADSLGPLTQPAGVLILLLTDTPWNHPYGPHPIGRHKASTEATGHVVRDFSANCTYV